MSQGVQQLQFNSNTSLFWEKTALFCSAALLLTATRSVLLVVYPLIPVLFYYIFGSRSNAKHLLLIGLISLSFGVSILYNQSIYLGNALTSLYILLPVLWIVFSKPSKGLNKALFPFFMKALRWIVLLNNSIGLIQYIITQDPDSFLGLYGTHGVGAHGLALFNFILAVYSFFEWRKKLSPTELLFLIIHTIGFIMSFYGMGLMMAMASIMLYFMLFKPRVHYFIFGIVAIIALIGLLYAVSPETIKYNINNIKLIVDLFISPTSSTDADVPRKLIAFVNWKKSHFTDLAIVGFGTGPGTYNSRTAFMLNGNYSLDNPFIKVFGPSQPPLAKEHIFPLWDTYQLAQIWNDGTRNQPFSSFISIMAEYGWLVGLYIYGYFAYLIARTHRSLNKKGGKLKTSVAPFFAITMVFFGLNLMMDNLFEYTEALVFLFILQFAQSTSGSSEKEEKDNNSLVI